VRTEAADKTKRERVVEPHLTAEQYQVLVDKVASELLDKSETFRKTIVYREMTTLATKWAAFIGIVNVVGLVSIYVAVSAFMQQTVSDKAARAVADRSDAVNESIRELTRSAISDIATMRIQVAQAHQTIDDGKNQVATMQADIVKLEQSEGQAHQTIDVGKKQVALLKAGIANLEKSEKEQATKRDRITNELDQAHRLLNAAETSIAESSRQADKMTADATRLKTTEAQLADSVKAINKNQPFFANTDNIRRLTDFITFISTNDNAKALSDLKAEVRALSTIVRESMAHSGTASVKEQLRQQIDEVQQRLGTITFPGIPGITKP